ncbi:hypothetical protein E3N88_46302 [Mikania micrantha]|uniref:Uncharacterized protein n=1 Tax=Mikania micrantha TaxID=192012 RepID=A0A5N6L6M9_9ASTR|nr:hypothetical protein E3N88_46302 [Mikania micrantha]
MVEHTKLVSQCLPWGVLHSWDLKEQTVGLSVLAIGMDQLASQCLLGGVLQCPMRLSMWWDGVWAGRRLDSGVYPIYKHTELDDTGGVNEVKVMHMYRLRLQECILGYSDRGPSRLLESTDFVTEANHF